MYLVILVIILAIAFLPHIDSDKLYNHLSQWVNKMSPELLASIEGVVARAGCTRTWEKYLLLWFVLGFPCGFLYFIFAVQMGIYNFGIHFSLSFSFFLGYLILVVVGRRRQKLMQADIRAVYRALKLVLRAGGTGEDALRAAIKYTKVLQKPLEGVLINWGEASYELLKLRNKFKGVDIENLVAYLLEVKKGISQGLIENIERQEQQMVFENGIAQAKANQLDDDIAQVTFSLFLLSQVYLVVMPLINENVRTFQNF